MLRRLKVVSLLMAASLVAGDASTKGPPPYTRKSIEHGQNVFLRNCASCHDRDGKAFHGREMTTTPPANLTEPESWLHGTKAEQIFTNIREGTPDEMPGFKEQLKDGEIWDLVNFIRSIWPEAMRPKLEEER
jgi:mono/diheme cytochrome c family protein